MTEDHSLKRKRMVRDQLVPRGIYDSRVLDAMDRVPRHHFVDEANQPSAYGDHPLSIGHSQTISQPYIVALMTEALELNGGEKVLEIGTGSGYQTAVLAELADRVYTIERIKPLLDRARNILTGLGYANISYLASDGTLGWPEQAPFEAVIVTAAGPKIPKTLIDQLADGGRLVIPVGNRYDQDLIKVTRHGPRQTRKNLGGCRFVSLVGVNAWKD